MSSLQKKKIPAKPCYTHIGGKLGALLLERFITKGWLEKDDATVPNYYITENGKIAFAEMGIDLSLINPE